MPRRTVRRCAFAALLIIAAGAPAGCGRQSRASVSSSLDLGSGVAEQRYLAPPQLLQASGARDGSVLLTGRAGPRAEVVVSSPEDQSYTAAADAHGRWSLHLPAAPQPRLYALSSQADGRMVHAQGAVVTAPDTAYAAVLVRAGYAALPLGGPARPAIVSLDYDPGGFAGVSGTGPPHGAVRLSIDGAAAGVTQTDAQGRFALLAANRRLALGRHRVQIETPAGPAAANFDMTPASPLNAPYRAEAAVNGWRVEWALNGGGVQTTLLLAAPSRTFRPGG